ncbi:hypothetical protein TIFTF001_051566 [Ficus carica]|uniref:Uncharacterized protein n=1 Tax=Ficus carica TaxID=3494 RepID=A0AA87ZGP2_FICCA|nr:hypothetical protein TIFTF001_051566 [Ficus carica]
MATKFHVTTILQIVGGQGDQIPRSSKVVRLAKRSLSGSKLDGDEIRNCDQIATAPTSFLVFVCSLSVAGEVQDLAQLRRRRGAAPSAGVLRLGGKSGPARLGWVSKMSK